jgi:hypothetical protein
MVLPLVQQDDTGTVGISSEGKSAAADWMKMILYDNSNTQYSSLGIVIALR